MAKPGRNDPCHCGSGKKYKKCCQPKVEAAEREVIAKDQAAREERAAVHRLERRATKAEVLARFAAAAAVPDELEELTAASNAAVALVKTCKLEEAEAAARDLLVRFPHVHDGWDRLGMVHEARGEKKQAADCYRKAIEIIRGQSENLRSRVCRRVRQARRQARPATRCLTYPITTFAIREGNTAAATINRVQIDRNIPSNCGRRLTKETLVTWGECYNTYPENWIVWYPMMDRAVATILLSGILASVWQITPQQCDEDAATIEGAMRERMATGRQLAYRNLPWAQLLTQLSDSALEGDHQAQNLRLAPATASAIEARPFSTWYGSSCVASMPKVVGALLWRKLPYELADEF